MECSVCLEIYNKTIRRNITCFFCNYSACLVCTKQYLLDSFNIPHCMNCRKEWSNTYLSQHLHSFMRNEYREKREILLFEKEKSKIPSLLPIAEKEKKIRLYNKYITNTQEELINWYKDYTRDIAWKNEKKNVKAAIRALVIKRDIIYRTDKAERKIFIMKCIMDDCRGFLSTRYKCSLCNTNVCPECHVVLKDEHKCNSDTVATIIELKKTTKPCPNCQTLIYKTEGCDQMWCIQCHTAFSWKSGHIEKGIIHNPHYFEFLKEKGTLPRNAMDIPCGGLPYYRSIYEFSINYLLSNDEISFLRILYENLSHHREVTLQTLPTTEEQVDNSDLLINYILHDITEKQCKRTLFVREQHRLRGIEERQMVEAYTTIGEEAFRKLISHHISIDELINEMHEVKEYTKRELDFLNNRYQHKGYISSHQL